MSISTAVPHKATRAADQAATGPAMPAGTGLHRDPASGAGGELAALFLAGSRHQPGIDPLPGAVVAPAVEIALRRARRILTRQGAPLAAGPQEIEDGVDDGPQVALARPPEPTPRRQERRNLRPLPGSRVACIAQLVTAILLPSGFSPHVVPPSLSANKTESQLTETTQFISGQPLRRRAAPSRRTQISSCSTCFGPHSAQKTIAPRVDGR
jgi:hypothetical protein